MMDIAWHQFKKPQRYIGNEWNAVQKTHHGRISVCLCFPDLYEVGMSNIGLRILYGYFNSFEDVVCERAFMPDEDFYQYLTASRIPLFSLETKTPLNEFDIIGFNLSCEFNYTNFLAMLAAGGLELEAAKRKNTIVLAGAVANPEGIAEFVDVFYLGEFEENLPRFLDVLRASSNKTERLRILAQMDGFYVPGFYEVFKDNGKFCVEKKYSPACLPLKKVYVRDLDNSFFPEKWLTPHTSIVHDRVQIEIARGCPNNCFFCQARCVYFPYRERSEERILELVKSVYNQSGYENISLLALSASDHSHIESILGGVVEYCLPRHIGVALPSLRVEDVSGKLCAVARRIKRVSATFAVEAATKTLRDKINKKIDVDKLFEASHVLKSLNSRHIKLYFMFGLPFEEESDLCAIGDFVREVRSKTRLAVHLSINLFIPKPFSRFEKLSLDNPQKLEYKRKLILKNIPRDRNIKLSISDVGRSLLEAAISRSDRRFSAVLRHAFLLGARFDAYQERFRPDIWQEAFSRSGIDMYEYLTSGTENFSWSHLSMERKGA